ncbi:hypothetical protein [Lactococcus garvieae]|uniref:hypothetical protein n=1 Tax=Lactococcus garvieae TaxID=1363 RepID=UPI002891F760|nr:hypothetical protein [Lactococcus garvieae]MDT2742895.1 hypothetical protein [Lactococcus garvieae]
MIKFKDFYVSDSDYEEQMELFQNEYPNAEFIQITGGHMSPERIWFKYDDELKEQPKLSIPKKIAEELEQVAVTNWEIWEFFIYAEEFSTELKNWLNHGKDDNANSKIAIAYLASKALGVEIVSIEED